MSYNIEPTGNLSKRELDNLVDQSKDLLDGDMDNALLKEFSQADLLELKKAFTTIMSDPSLSQNQVNNLASEGWRMLYYQKPPSIEEFLSPEWLGVASYTIRQNVREWLLEWYNPVKGYRNCFLAVP